MNFCWTEYDKITFFQLFSPGFKVFSYAITKYDQFYRVFLMLVFFYTKERPEKNNNKENKYLDIYDGRRHLSNNLFDFVENSIYLTYYWCVCVHWVHLLCWMFIGIIGIINWVYSIQFKKPGSVQYFLDLAGVWLSSSYSTPTVSHCLCLNTKYY